MENPLLIESKLFLQTIPFDKIRTEHFMPALDAVIQEALERKRRLVEDLSEPNFSNFLIPLETLTDRVSWVSGIFFYLFSAEADAELQKLAGEFSQKVTRFHNDVSLDPILFAKTKKIFEQKEKWPKDPEGQKLIEETYQGFVRQGANLSESDKQKLREIDDKLSTLSPKFMDNVLKSTNEFEMWLSSPEELDGLPPSALAAAEDAAKSKGKSGYLVTLHGPSYQSFITYASNRTLREKIWRAQSSRAFGGALDNQQIIREVVSLKHARSKLLGYKNYADYALQKRMAATSDKVWSFLRELASKSKPAAIRDVAQVAALKKELTNDSDFQPWDYAYYKEKLQNRDYAFDNEMWRPYLRLESVLEGVFTLAKKLFSVEFIERKDLPIYHPDVRSFEVRDSRNQNVLGVFYTDFFPRETKKSGAWCSTPRPRGLTESGLALPIVSIVCNFTKPTSTEPSLLTLEEVRTIFHEFGHALHNLLTECQYPSLSGTSVYWDFVELPSQLLENWTLESDTLKLIAKHYKTGAPVPADLVEKTRRAEKFQAGYSSLRQLMFGFLDMSWFSSEISDVTDIPKFESEVLRDLRVLPDIPGTNISSSFSHIFAGGYSAGYYSYKWAEVLDADAFEFFKQNGTFNQEIGMKYRSTILAKGGSVHPEQLYIEFRGQPPSMEPLLKRDGLL